MNVAKNLETINEGAGLLNLLCNKIEECMLNDSCIVILDEGDDTSSRNTITIDDFETDVDYIYLNNQNYELHLHINEDTKFLYDEGNGFKIVFKNRIVCIYFL